MSWYAYCLTEQQTLNGSRARRPFLLEGIQGVNGAAMPDVVLPDTVGGEYLVKLREKASKDRERQTKARALSVQVHKLFNPLEEEISCKRVHSDGMLIDIAHLIDSKSVEKYQNRYS